MQCLSFLRAGLPWTPGRDVAAAPKPSCSSVLSTELSDCPSTSVPSALLSCLPGSAGQLSGLHGNSTSHGCRSLPTRSYSLPLSPPHPHIPPASHTALLPTNHHHTPMASCGRLRFIPCPAHLLSSCQDLEDSSLEPLLVCSGPWSLDSGGWSWRGGDTLWGCGAMAALCSVWKDVGRAGWKLGQPPAGHPQTIPEHSCGPGPTAPGGTKALPSHRPWAAGDRVVTFSKRTYQISS